MKGKILNSELYLKAKEEKKHISEVYIKQISKRCRRSLVDLLSSNQNNLQNEIGDKDIVSPHNEVLSFHTHYLPRVESFFPIVTLV